MKHSVCTAISMRFYASTGIRHIVSFRLSLSIEIWLVELGQGIQVIAGCLTTKMVRDLCLQQSCPPWGVSSSRACSTGRRGSYWSPTYQLRPCTPPTKFAERVHQESGEKKLSEHTIIVWLWQYIIILYIYDLMWIRINTEMEQNVKI